MPQVEPTGQHGHMATRGGQSVPEAKKKGKIVNISETESDNAMVIMKCA